MTSPKRHHYVPRLILREFADNERKIWYYTKKNFKGDILQLSIDNTFVEGHLHSLEREDGSKNPSLELYFRDLETVSAPILKKILSCVRSGRRPNLTNHEKNVWDLFFFYQRKRSPDVINPYLYSAKFEPELQDLIKNYEANVRPLTENEKHKLRSSDTVDVIRNNARVHAIGFHGEKVLPLLNSMGIGFLRIKKFNKSLLIGSNSVHKLTNRFGVRLGLPGVQAWLPVAPDVAISPMGQKGQEYLITLPDDQWLRDLNRHIFLSSTSVGSRSRALIRSIINYK